MTQTVAEVLVDQMVEAGIRKRLRDRRRLGEPDRRRACAGTRPTSTFVHVRNEEAGAFAAGADAQISGRPTAVLGSSGPGSVHLLNGLYDCQRNGAPVFAIATHIPSTEIGTGYFQETEPGADLRGLLQLRRHDRVARADAADRPSSRCRRRSSSAASAW